VSLAGGHSTTTKHEYKQGMLGRARPVCALSASQGCSARLLLQGRWESVDVQQNELVRALQPLSVLCMDSQMRYLKSSIALWRSSATRNTPSIAPRQYLGGCLPHGFQPTSPHCAISGGGGTDTATMPQRETRAGETPLLSPSFASAVPSHGDAITSCPCCRRSPIRSVIYAHLEQ
jgi:hypothetical protein